MCTNYTPATPSHLLAMRELAGVVLPSAGWPVETFPGYLAPIIFSGPGGAPVCKLASFGLVPRWCRDGQQANTVSRRTYNARSETVAEKPSYRGPWRDRQWALAPMVSYFEPCWESGRAVRWCMRRSDDAPFAVAGLHETWTDRSSGEIVRSFTLLTVNADAHPVLRRMHRPDDEKRQLVVVPPAAFGRWLGASQDQAHSLLHGFRDDGLTGAPAPRSTSAPPVASQQVLDF